MKYGWLAVLCVVAMMVTTVQAKDWSVSALTDSRTNMVEGRVEKVFNDVWRVGFLGTYFADGAANPGKDWGIGGFAKLMVDPNATFPVANWFPKVGDWLKLPETLTAETYLIGKLQALPFEGNVDLCGSIGAGAKIGPILIEYVYNIIESGDADNPALDSAAVLWVGIEPIRF